MITPIDKELTEQKLICLVITIQNEIISISYYNMIINSIERQSKFLFRDLITKLSSINAELQQLKMKLSASRNHTMQKRIKVLIKFSKKR